MPPSLLLNFIKLMAILICQQQMKTVVISVNVALNKVASDCNNKVLAKITDGNKKPSSSDILDEYCRRISINLVNVYDIHYVVVYAGEETNELMEFVINLSDGIKTQLCTNFWGLIVTSEYGVRMNCQMPDKMYSVVDIRAYATHELSISEIEVHNLASEIPGKRLKYFRGCFKIFGEKDEISMSPMIPEDCQSHCTDSKFLFFGVKENSHCLCANDYDVRYEMPPESCDILCNDGLTSCGGAELTSVYLGVIRLPSYQNCEIVADHLSRKKGNMTVSKCLRHCDNYNYAALKGGDSCYCTNIFTGVINTKRCHKRCGGNSDEICGGDRYTSVYQTCLKLERASIKCSEQFKCAGSYDKYGLCRDGCKEGFLGDYCLQRDYPIATTVPTTVPITVITTVLTTVPSTITTTVQSICQNPNHCADKSYTECVIHKGAPKCVCIVGYSRTNPFSECEDIDECEFQPCDAETAVCINSNGSYICECLPGFSRKIVLSDVCLANVSVGNELQVNHHYYLMILANAAPMFSILVLFVIVCIYALPKKSESLSLDKIPEIEIKKPKASAAPAIASTKKL